MIEPVNRSPKILQELRENGQVTPLDQPHHLEAIFEMNEALANDRRDFIIRNAKSEQSAEHCIVK